MSGTNLHEILHYWFVEGLLFLLLVAIARRVLGIDFDMIRRLVLEFGDFLARRPTIGAVNITAILAVTVVGIMILFLLESENLAQIFDKIRSEKLAEFRRASNPLWLAFFISIVAVISLWTTRSNRD
jgi:hypothetical protein